VRRRPAAPGAPEGNERERLGEEAASGDRREAAAALRRVLRLGEEEAAEGWRQTARVEIWVGRWTVEGTEASVAGAAGVRKEREREKEAKGRLGSSRGRAAGSESEAAAMVDGGGC
jgi:hypothetical protein